MEIGRLGSADSKLLYFKKLVLSVDYELFEREMLHLVGYIRVNNVGAFENLRTASRPLNELSVLNCDVAMFHTCDAQLLCENDLFC